MSIFHAPSTIVFGGGSRHELAEQIRFLSVGKVLIVSDEYLHRSGMLDQFTDHLERERIRTTIFSGVQPDPTIQNIQDGLDVLRSSAAEAIVAIGGGSAIDVAKIIGVAAVNSGPVQNLEGSNKIAVAGLPLVAIPTTSGTGSEVTKVAVIADPDRKVKMMILDPKLMPRTAIVDFELTMSMPAALTAHVGVDTFTHGLEAYVSAKANAMTDPIAKSCMRLTAKHVVDAWRDPGNRAAREAMSLAACQGGMAFTNSSVCLVHGMSRPLGALFHVPHGLSNAVLLPTVTRFSLPGAKERYGQAARLVGWAAQDSSDEIACNALVDGLENLNKQLQVPRLRDCVSVSEASFESVLKKMAADALQSGSPRNNPIVPTAEQIADLYRQAW